MVDRLVLVLLAAALVSCASSAERRQEEEKRQRMVGTNIELAASYLQRGQLAIALTNVEKALELDDDSSQAHNMMALVQWRLKQTDKAEKHFREAVHLDPSNAEAQNNYGVFLCSLNRVDEAVERFDKAIANPLYATPAQANTNAGVCLLKKGASAKAERYFEKALKLDPNAPAALFNMAQLKFQHGKRLSARGYIERLFATANGETPESLLLAIKIEHALGGKDAEASYRLRLNGKYPDSKEARSLRR